MSSQQPSHSMGMSSGRAPVHGHGLAHILGPMTSYPTAEATHPPHPYMLPAMRSQDIDGSGSSSVMGGAAPGVQYGQENGRGVHQRGQQM